MKKKLLIALSAVMMFSTLTIGCSKEEEPKETKEIKIVVPDGLPSMAVSKLIKENPEVKKGYKQSYSIEKTPENIVSQVLKGEPDIAIVPSNVASTQYNKKAGYKIAGTVGWGSFYVISSEGEGDLNTLKGKEVYNIGRGLTPDIIMRTLLKDKGIDPDKDVNFSYVNGAAELPPVVLTGKAKYAVVPEPALTTIASKKQDIKTIVDVNEEWKKAYNSEYGFPQATIIIKESLLKDDKAFVEAFLKEVDGSIKWAYENKEELSNYCEEIGVSANKAIIPKAMEKANLKFVNIKDSKDEYNNYFKKLNEFDPKTIGGAVPDEGIFME
ncbi:MAG: ABC transporter substrate-binding protein [Clostridium sp.]